MTPKLQSSEQTFAKKSSFQEAQIIFFRAVKPTWNLLESNNPPWFVQSTRRSLCIFVFSANASRQSGFLLSATSRNVASEPIKACSARGYCGADMKEARKTTALTFSPRQEVRLEIRDGCWLWTEIDTEAFSPRRSFPLKCSGPPHCSMNLKKNFFFACLKSLAWFKWCNENHAYQPANILI